MKKIYYLFLLLSFFLFLSCTIKDDTKLNENPSVQKNNEILQTKDLEIKDYYLSLENMPNGFRIANLDEMYNSI
jgi:hypothetical protein